MENNILSVIDKLADVQKILYNTIGMIPAERHAGLRTKMKSMMRQLEPMRSHLLTEYYREGNSHLQAKLIEEQKKNQELTAQLQKLQQQ